MDDSSDSRESSETCDINDSSDSSDISDSSNSSNTRNSNEISFCLDTIADIFEVIMTVGSVVTLQFHYGKVVT